MRIRLEDLVEIDLPAPSSVVDEVDQLVGMAATRNYMALKADASFTRAVVAGDRHALRAAVTRKAAELGCSADALMLDYTMELVDDAATRYGIDLAGPIDREKLARAGQVFLEDLTFKIADLARVWQRSGEIQFFG